MPTCDSTTCTWMGGGGGAGEGGEGRGGRGSGDGVKFTTNLIVLFTDTVKTFHHAIVCPDMIVQPTLLRLFCASIMTWRNGTGSSNLYSAELMDYDEPENVQESACVSCPCWLCQALT